MQPYLLRLTQVDQSGKSLGWTGSVSRHNFVESFVISLPTKATLSRRDSDPVKVRWRPDNANGVREVMAPDTAAQYSSYPNY
jgi:hypothetical protein